MKIYIVYIILYIINGKADYNKIKGGLLQFIPGLIMRGIVNAL